MNTISGTFRFVVLGVIVMVVVVSCCTFGLLKDTTSQIKVGNSYVYLGNTKNGTYVEWKKEGDFNQALAQVSRNPNGKEICVCVLESSGTPYPHRLNNCPDYRCPLPGNVRTVKVTKSKAADNIAAGESVVNDPNVMYKVRSPVPADIIKVLGTLK